MSDIEIQRIADNADMIIAGYAYTKTEDGTIRVINLYNIEEACVLMPDGTMLETTMDDITLLKTQAYYLKNKEFMEGEYA